MRKWYLAISPSPERRSRGGSVASASVSQITPHGCQNAPTRFLPSGRLTAGLAADGGVDHRQQRRRHVDHGDAAMPHGGGESGDVGDHPPADGDDDVVASQADAGERSGHVLDGHQRLALLAGADVDAHDRAVAEQGA